MKECGTTVGNDAMQLSSKEIDVVQRASRSRSAAWPLEKRRRRRRIGRKGGGGGGWRGVAVAVATRVAVVVRLRAAFVLADLGVNFLSAAPKSKREQH